MYKLYKYLDTVVGAEKANSDGGRIAFNFSDPANTDYAKFKKDINEGAELQDADGNTMTAEQAKDFVKELP